MSNDISKRQAINKLWEKGILHWLLDDTQKGMYDFFKERTEKITIFLCSRRLGKSHLACLLALETCIKAPNSIVKYLCPTQRMVQTIILPIMRTLTENCPKSKKPTYKVKDGIFVFPNGSEIQMAGTDNGNIERIRGGASNLCIVDEAGFCDEMTYAINSVLMPTTLTTSGRILMLSTPPKNANHEFNDFVRMAQEKNTLIKKTIFDNPRLSPAQIQETIESYMGGMKNPEFRREYLCENIQSADTMIIPEFSEDVEKEVVVPWLRPPHYDYYVSADIGFKDFTAVLFGYLDFKNAKFIIEDELIVNKITTKELADKIKEKENHLLFDPIIQDMKQPHLRVCDNNLFVINDLQRLHGITFLPTAKDDLEAAVNNTRILVGGKQIIINPRCTTLIRHIKNGNWKKSDKKRQFARSSDDGHYDALAALIYMVRNIDWNRSPYPAGYEYRNMPSRYQIRESIDNSFGKQLSKQFKIKRSL